MFDQQHFGYGILFPLCVQSRWFSQTLQRQRADFPTTMRAVSRRNQNLAASFPFLTSYDPSGTSEGTLDPLGLYQIADQLAVQLVPGVRERMQRIRFLTAMAVGSLVTEDLEDNPELRDTSPYLVWEWLVVEALIRTKEEDPG